MGYFLLELKALHVLLTPQEGTDLSHCGIKREGALYLNTRSSGRNSIDRQSSLMKWRVVGFLAGTTDPDTQVKSTLVCLWSTLKRTGVFRYPAKDYIRSEGLQWSVASSHRIEIARCHGDYRWSGIVSSSFCLHS